MIPGVPRDGANRSEKQIFMALESLMDTRDWTVIHSMQLAQNLGATMGECDFAVLIPGKGIVLIEAKTAEHVQYREGDWYLAKSPAPTKDPFKQLVIARSSIRGYLRQHELLDDGLPIARLVWFTNLSRHQFENRSRGDMQFFEWELGWQEDLAKPAWLIEKVIDEHLAWFSSVDGVDFDGSVLTPERADQMASALLGDFTVTQTKSDRAKARRIAERALIEEQEFALELVEDNPHVFFDGPAGTGKSLLLATAARSLAKQGHRTLVTCWNVLMADELRLLVGRPEIEVFDLNSLMLQIIGEPTNPPAAGDEWYRRELPERALSVLREKPYLGAFEAILVDEFQDVAGNPLLVEILFALAGTGSADGTVMLLAGDDRQQILRTGEAVRAFDVAKASIPDLVHVRLRRNCRNVPELIHSAEKRLGRSLGFTRHRLRDATPGGLERVEVARGRETSALASALKRLLEHHEPHEIVVLSPFGERSSLVGSFLARPEASADERWLRKQLATPGGGGIRWRSIFKFKGLDAEAVVLTDIDPAAREWVESTGIDWDDLLYVGMTRGRYRCVMFEGETNG
ncbi:NERD domain-containing protein [Salinibacterium sp. ZJ77]|uniref:nuclease-related domain-containing DEAD/DEAH box helicase n=1 Tax=Salinibacterium sp. ZJ77 TaxID=2708337 RepID=UPI002443A94E|nr:NERD domain-containing protein [Salinibacterium sp. ZJ77]